MSRIKKALASILIVGIMTILGTITISEGYYSDDQSFGIGSQFEMTNSIYLNSQKLFCVEYHIAAPQVNNQYRVRGGLKIYGDMSRPLEGDGYIIRSIENSRLGYILTAKKDKNIKKYAVWKEINQWFEDVGAYYNMQETGGQFTINTNANLGVPQNEDEGLYDDACTKYTGLVPYPDKEKFLQEEDWDKALKEGKFVDNTKRDKVVVKREGENLAIGPFNWNIEGNEVEAVSVGDGNGKSVAVNEFCYWDGTKYTPLPEGIQNNKDFYMVISAKNELSKIKEIDVKVNAKIPFLNLYFVECLNNASQSLILSEDNSKEEPLNYKLEDYDIPFKGSIRIKKMDEDTKKPLVGVGFVFINKSNGQYLGKDKESGDWKYTPNIKEAHVAYTEMKQIKGEDAAVLEVPDIDLGKYEALEVVNPYHIYRKVSLKNPLSVGDVEAKVKPSDPKEIKYDDIYNKQKYVKLSGYVWVDRIDAKGGEGTPSRNDYYRRVIDKKADNNDKLFDKIIVRLMDSRTGKVVKDEEGKPMETITREQKIYKGLENHNGHGTYQFEGVDIDALKYYYIEFEYDGLTYQNVVPHVNNGTNKEYASKASEGTKRSEFNEKFAVVEGNGGDSRDTGYTRDSEGNKQDFELRYDIDETVTAETKPTAKLNTKWKYTENEEAIGVKVASIEGGEDYVRITADTKSAKYSIYNEYLQTKNESAGDINDLKHVKYINLGLFEREQPNLELHKDVKNVKIEINNKGYVYTKGYGEKGLETNTNVHPELPIASKYDEKVFSYTRGIYQTDYECENLGDDKELKVYVTYVIGITNTSTSLYTRVNSIVDYYDSKYDELVGVGREVDENGNIINEIEVQKDKVKYNDKYNKVIIPNNDIIKPTQNDGAEANQEKIYVQFKLSRAQVEAILNQEGEEEKILRNVAEINSYSVFDKNGDIYAGIDEDSNPGNCIPGQVNTYEDDTDTSPALRLVADGARKMTGTVFLDEARSDELMPGQERIGDGIYGEEKEKGISGVKVTLEETSGADVASITTTTDKDGNFEIAGYIPGDYKLTYTWGDGTYVVVNDTPQTKITTEDYKGTIYINKGSLNNTKWYEAEDPRYSDAIDAWEVGSGSRPEEMNSITPEMNIGVEYKAITTSSEAKFENEIKHIDFGIIERPRQDIGFSKKVSGIKLTLANGQTIIDATIDENGKIIGDHKGLTYGPPSNGDKGWVKAEIDNELIQGATLQIKYTIRVENNSELDYETQEYYTYGEVPADKDKYVVKLIAEGVYDYLDSEMALDTSKDNGKWEVVSRDQYEKKYEGDPTAIEKFYKEWTEIKEDGTIIEHTKWEKLENLKPMFEEWEEIITEQRTVRDAKLGNKTILYNEDLEGETKPRDVKSVDLYVSKLLANTDEINLDNEAEIPDVRKTRDGGKTHDIPNYTFGETVKVTPPTGENQDYIVPIIVGATAFILLGAGIVIIKKKVL